MRCIYWKEGKEVRSQMNEPFETMRLFNECVEGQIGLNDLVVIIRWSCTY
jgi:hypothetical protein